MGTSSRASLLVKIATTVFVGVPMTFALIVALAFYCAFEIARFGLVDGRKAVGPPVQSNETSFTESLVNLAQNPGVTDPALEVQETKHEQPAS